MAERNPFEGVTDYFSELNRMRHLGTRGREHAPVERERTHADAWVPTTDIYADGDDLVIEVELPGVDPDDVDLRFAHGVLTVSGSRAGDPAKSEAGFYVRERYHGEFRRAVTLPEGTEPEQISAEFDNGLVEITVTDGVTRSDENRIELKDRSSGPSRRSL